MKKVILMVGLTVLGLGQSARGDFVQAWSSGFANGGVIPDGSLVGWSDTRTLATGLTAPISDVNVTLNLSGGWNGDLYAYLVHDTGFAVLLNRVGRTSSSTTGYGDAGMNVRLDDAGALGDIHTYGGGTPTAPFPPTSANSYKPDARNITPLASFDTTSRTALLSVFNGLNADGNWTLYLADVTGGDVSTLQSWTLEIAAVPEPASWLEGAVAALFLGGAIGLYRLKGGGAYPFSRRIATWRKGVSDWVNAV